MAGIYIHIPFCRQACHYCNFHFSTSFKTKEEMIKAMLREIEMQAGYLDGQEIQTIYFGGGTPSALPIEDIISILDVVANHHCIASTAEITLEANPDDLHAAGVTEWKDAGINRLSIGIQAFQDDLLAAWNRSHNAREAMEAVAVAQQAGIDNITVDLIYGGPGLSDEDWVSNIQRLIDAGIPHVSSYALTVETGTALHHQIEKGKSKVPEDEQANRQYAILQEMLTANGIMQYEVSNFAKSGFESRHNRSYWSGAHYLGIGPSAHSYNGVSRQWNVSNNVKYIQSIVSGLIPSEKEMLTDAQRFNELVMTGLRTSMGIDMKRVASLGEKFEQYLTHQIESALEAKYIGGFEKNETGNWMLRNEFLFFADGIAAELFYEGEF
ncbi:MAG: radical SAM family heme chaperone HemW [Saprospiraceae bacterium]|nr:radical SAM family heme chaperone HemW [Saprospiraceae bacterium]